MATNTYAVPNSDLPDDSDDHQSPEEGAAVINSYKRHLEAVQSELDQLKKKQRTAKTYDISIVWLLFNSCAL